MFAVRKLTLEKKLRAIEAELPNTEDFDLMLVLLNELTEKFEKLERDIEANAALEEQVEISDEMAELNAKIMHLRLESEKQKAQAEYMEIQAAWCLLQTVVNQQVDAVSLDIEEPLAVFYLEQLRACQTETKNIAAQLLKPSYGHDLDPVQAEIQTVIFNITQAMATCTKVIMKEQHSQSSTDGSSTIVNNCNGKSIGLPKLHLNNFDGNLINWLPFRDLFVRLVVENPNLSDVERLAYLKSTLQGAPLDLLKNIQTTEQNFSIAWKLLQDRFSNPRDLVSAHVERLLNLPQIVNEDASSLRKLVDTIKEVLRALEILNRQDKLGEDLIVYLASKCLPEKTRQDWILSLPNGTPLELNSLLEFSERKANALASSSIGDKGLATPGQSKIDKPNQRNFNNHKRRISTNQVSTGASTVKCEMCSQAHRLYQCMPFLRKIPSERRKFVTDKNLCLNCLKNHSGRSCLYSIKCRVCQQNHNVLVHLDVASVSDKGKKTPNPSGTVASTSVTNSTLVHTINSVTGYAKNKTSTSEIVLLNTAQVLLQDKYGNYHKFRSMIDTGSMKTLVTERVAQKLQLPRSKTNIEVSGINDSTPLKVRGAINVTVGSHYDPDFEMSVEALVLSKLAHILPTEPFEIDAWRHLEGLHLADDMCNVPGKIDVIFGQDVFHDIMLTNRVYGTTDSPIATESSFGYVLGGRINVPRSSNLKTVPVCLSVTSISKQVQRFWELDKVPDTPCKLLSVEDQIVEDHFKANTIRLNDGRYQVRLPLKKDPTILGDSTRAAEKVLFSVEKRLAKDPVLCDQYHKVLEEYQELGHMTKKEDQGIMPIYVLPHHPVVKNEHLTTKVRVVFNASAKTEAGVSLNDCQYIGARNQPELFDVLLQFRTHKYAIICDIIKMFRQVAIHPDDRSLQTILWRKNPSLPIEEYELNTVTFGLTSSPFLATRVLNQLAEDEGNNFLLAKTAILNHTFVDDILSGTSSIPKAKKLCQELIDLCRLGKFELNKWASNSPAALENIVDPDVIVHTPKNLDRSATLKILGMSWFPHIDCFQLQTTVPDPEAGVLTKRIMLSQMASIYDPLGLFTPVTLWTKLQLQQLFKMKVTWDQPVPSEMQASWLEFRRQLVELSTIKLPRFTGNMKNSSFQLIAFSDASLLGYSAVIYTREISNDRVSVRLLCARSKVVPCSSPAQLTVPRLELCAAVLLVKLVHRVANILQVSHSQLRCYTDSSIVIGWLQNLPKQYNAFVANRIALVKELLPDVSWRYVPTRFNPADAATRGLLPLQLVAETKWWEGPEFLQINPITEFSLAAVPDITLELRKQQSTQLVAPILIMAEQTDLGLPERLSSWTKVVAATAYVFRFFVNTTPCGPKFSGPLSIVEINRAMNYQFKVIQKKFFKDDIDSILKLDRSRSTSKLLPLDPFIDKDGVLRVGGRLGFALISDQAKHPAILPARCRLSELILVYFHKKYLHAGPQLLLFSSRQLVWILGGRIAARQTVSKCTVCARFKTAEMTQLLGQLPPARSRPSRAFSFVGIDYAGPITLKAKRGARYISYKGYIAVFVCFFTRAIHLEVVTSASTDEFLCAFKRFRNRRGRPVAVYSDHGRCFVGARHELKRLLKSAIADQSDVIARMLAEDKTEWCHIPVAAPHFGGLWESAVKSVKHHLYRISCSRDWTYEELSTVLSDIEGCLNSRPLMAPTSDPDDLAILTPAHFLGQQDSPIIPSPDLTAVSGNLSSTFETLQKETQMFWKRWQQEYLNQLAPRKKWRQRSENLKVGDAVVLRHEHLPPSKWRIGRVIQLHPGRDGLVRVVSLKTRDGIIKRTIKHIVLLPTS